MEKKSSVMVHVYWSNGKLNPLTSVCLSKFPYLERFIKQYACVHVFATGLHDSRGECGQYRSVCHKTTCVYRRGEFGQERAATVRPAAQPSQY